MYNFLLDSLYYKSFVNTNFVNRKNKINSLLKNDFLKYTLISLECYPKMHNKKIFVILMLLMEFIIKGNFINKSKISFFCKNKNNSKLKITINYLIPANKYFILLESYIHDYSWAEFCFNESSIKNKFIYNLNEPKTIVYSMYKLLDCVYLVQNKIQFEKFFLKKKYKLKISLTKSNYWHSLWWLKVIGYLNIKTDINL